MALSVPVAAAGASGSGRGGSVAFPGALTNARVSPHSRLFGFVRFHEDGARTKALLGKVRQPGDGARTRSPQPAPRSLRTLRPGQCSLWQRTRVEGLPENCCLALPSPTPGYLADSLAKSPSHSWRNGDGSALGPSSTGSTKLLVLFRLFGGRLRISKVPV